MTNRGGYFATSLDFLSVTVSDVPQTPSSGPHSDVLVTDDTKIRILYAEPGNGGSVLTNYEVVMDDGLGGGFITIAGGATQTYLLNDIVISNAASSGYIFEIQRGLHYRFRYRS